MSESFVISSPQSFDEQSLRGHTHTLRDKGALHLSNCFEPGLIGSAQAYFSSTQLNQSREAIEKSCLQVGHERFMFSVNLDGAFLDPALYASPRVIPVLAGLLGGDFIIQSMTVVCAFPGARQQHIHTDLPLLFPEVGQFNALCPPYAFTVAIPLLDLTESTGTTAMWEGSHRLLTDQDETSPENSENSLAGAFLPLARSGDCYIMDIRLRHAGTENRSEAPRPVLYIVYSRPWFEDRRNFELQAHLEISEDNWLRIPKEYQPLFRRARFSSKRHA